MGAARALLVALVPATAIGAYWALGRDSDDDFRGLITMLGFSVTFAGALVSAVALRRHLATAGWLKISASAFAAAALLLALVPTLPRWPFADTGLILSWLIASAAVVAASIWFCSVGMPNKSLERGRDG